MLANEKYWYNPSTYEYNIITVSYWLLGEYSDRERVNNGARGFIWLKHDIYRPKVPRKNPLGLSRYTFKNEGKKIK
jgi:hypothetical protein